MSYFLHILILVEIYCILVICLNMQLGFSRLLNLAIATFYALGAYSYSIIGVNYHLSFFILVSISILLNMLISIVISYASTRFKEEIFVLITIAFHMITYSILLNVESITGGVNGINNIPPPIIFGYHLDSKLDFTLLGGLFLFLTIIFSVFLHKSKYGRTLKAIRDNEIVAKSIGKNISFFKASNIAISCGISSLAGVILASYIGYIDTSNFNLDVSIDILLILMLGGLLSTKGAIFGTITYFIISEVFRFVGLNDDIAFNIRIILFSVTVIFLLYKKPNGLFGQYNIN